MMTHPTPLMLKPWSSSDARVGDYFNGTVNFNLGVSRTSEFREVLEVRLADKIRHNEE